MHAVIDLEQEAFVTVPPSSETAPPTTLGVRRRTNQLAGVLTFRLGLPLDLALGDVVRTIRFNVDYTTDAQTGTWLFPPK